MGGGGGTLYCSLSTSLGAFFTTYTDNTCIIQSEVLNLGCTCRLLCESHIYMFSKDTSKLSSSIIHVTLESICVYLSVFFPHSLCLGWGGVVGGCRYKLVLHVFPVISSIGVLFKQSSSLFVYLFVLQHFSVTVMCFYTDDTSPDVTLCCWLDSKHQVANTDDNHVQFLFKFEVGLQLRN